MKRAMDEVTDDRQIDQLYSRLSEVFEQVRNESTVDIFGNIDFEIVRSIDNKRLRIAKLKGNKILVHEKAIGLPDTALRYLVVHELAHSITKGHTRRFWKIVETIYPTFESGQSLLLKHGRKVLRQTNPIEDG